MSFYDFKSVADLGTVESDDGRGGYAMERVDHAEFGAFVSIAVERESCGRVRRVGRIRVEQAALRRVGAMLLNAARAIEDDAASRREDDDRIRRGDRD